MKPITLWTDNLDLPFLWQLWLYKKKHSFAISSINYFGRTNKIAQWLAPKLIPEVSIQKYLYDTSCFDVKDTEAIFWHIWRDAAHLGTEIINKTSAADLIFNSLPKEKYDPLSLNLYFKRQIAYEQKKNLGIIHLVAFYLKQERGFFFAPQQFHVHGK